MSDPWKRKSCKTNPTESRSKEKQQTLVQGLTSTANSYISQFVTYVKGLLSKKQITSNDLKGLICKSEEKIKQVYEKILEQAKVFRENELQACKHYSKEELAKAETTLKEYSVKIQKILDELRKRLRALKNKLQTKIMTHKEVHSLITYFEEQFKQTKKLTQETIKHIQETVKDPALKRKLQAMVENNYKKIKTATDDLYTAVKEGSAVREHKCIKPDPTDAKSLKSTMTTYIGQIVTYVRGLVFKKIADQGETPIPQDVKDLLAVTEVKVKELYDGILKKVKDLHDNELQTYKNYSKEELVKVTSNLQEYSAKVRKLSEETLKRLKDLKNELQNKMITHQDFESFVLYFENKLIETKKLTEEMIKNIRATIKEPALGKKLETMVEINSKKIKIAFDDLCTAIKKNLAKVGEFKTFTDKKRLFSKIPTFDKLKRPINCSSAVSPSTENDAATGDCKGNSTIGLNRDKLPLFNLSKHFNSKTIYGRANVAKATYAGILIYYIYRKVKNTTT